MMKDSIKIFWAEVVVFIFLVISMAVPFATERIMGLPFILIAGGVFFLLGSTLSWKVYKKRERKLLDKFLLACGLSGVGILPAVILHNLIYALFEYFKPGFWNGGDEPVFLILAVIVLPLIFIIGAIGTIYLLIGNHEES